MKVERLTSAEHVRERERAAALAALTCHANTNREFVPADVLGRIIKARHESILEHITLTYSIKGISRALLQELARHRHISLSVESTRHTLRKYLNGEGGIMRLYAQIPAKYHVALQDFLYTAKGSSELSNDELKYYLPEFWPVNLVLTSNIRELRHILDLRTAPAALKEFRDLARAMYEAVPEEFKYLLKDCVHDEADNDTN